MDVSERKTLTEGVNLIEGFGTSQKQNDGETSQEDCDDQKDDIEEYFETEEIEK